MERTRQEKDYVYKDLLNIARIKTKTIKVSVNFSAGGELSQQPYILRLPATTA